MSNEPDPRLLSAEQLATIRASVETPKLVDAGMDEIEARYGSAELGLLNHVDAQAERIIRLTAALEGIADTTWPVGCSISAAGRMIANARAVLSSGGE